MLGSYYFKRGLDDQGNTANFTETEQIIQLYSIDKQIENQQFQKIILSTQSFKMIRGDLPLSFVDIGRRKELQIKKNKSEVQQDFNLHYIKLKHKYQEVIYANLLNNNSDNENLNKTIRELCNQNQITLRQCDNMQKINMFIRDELLPFIEKQSYYYYNLQNSQIQLQKGVLKVFCQNGIDCCEIFMFKVFQYQAIQFLQKEAFFDINQTNNYIYQNIVMQQYKKIWQINNNQLRLNYLLYPYITIPDNLDEEIEYDEGQLKIQEIFKQNIQDLYLQNCIDAIAVHPYIKFDNLQDKIQQQVDSFKQQQYSFSVCQELNVMLLTWNINGQVPEEKNFLEHVFELNKKKLQKPDILVVNFQEMVNFKLKTIIKGHHEERKMLWSNMIFQQLQGDSETEEYQLINQQDMVGCFISIFVRIPIVKKINSMQNIEHIKCGFMGMAGNKGGIVFKMNINQLQLCFLCCHLPAGKESQKERLESLHKIHEKAINPAINQNHGVQAVQFLVGDLNFRSNLDYEAMLSFIFKHRKANMNLNYNDPDWNNEFLDLMYKTDQLYDAMQKDQVLKNYKEDHIKFLPTYKFDLHTNTYDTSKKKRVPSWCDRILTQKKGVNVDSQFYESIEFYTCSDHKPVRGYYQIKYYEIIPEYSDQYLENEKLNFKFFAEEFLGEVDNIQLSGIIQMRMGAGKKLKRLERYAEFKNNYMCIYEIQGNKLVERTKQNSNEQYFYEFIDNKNKIIMFSQGSQNQTILEFKVEEEDYLFWKHILQKQQKSFQEAEENQIMITKIENSEIFKNILSIINDNTQSSKLIQDNFMLDKIQESQKEEFQKDNIQMILSNLQNSIQDQPHLESAEYGSNYSPKEKEQLLLEKLYYEQKKYTFQETFKEQILNCIAQNQQKILQLEKLLSQNNISINQRKEAKIEKYNLEEQNVFLQKQSIYLTKKCRNLQENALLFAQKLQNLAKHIEEKYQDELSIDIEKIEEYIENSKQDILDYKQASLDLSQRIKKMKKKIQNYYKMIIQIGEYSKLSQLKKQEIMQRIEICQNKIITFEFEEDRYKKDVERIQNRTKKLLKDLSAGQIAGESPEKNKNQNDKNFKKNQKFFEKTHAKFKAGDPLIQSMMFPQKNENCNLKYVDHKPEYDQQDLITIRNNSKTYGENQDQQEKEQNFLGVSNILVNKPKSHSNVINKSNGDNLRKSVMLNTKNIKKNLSKNDFNIKYIPEVGFQGLGLEQNKQNTNKRQSININLFGAESSVRDKKNSRDNNLLTKPKRNSYFFKNIDMLQVNQKGKEFLSKSNCVSSIELKQQEFSFSKSPVKKQGENQHVLSKYSNLINPLDSNDQLYKSQQFIKGSFNTSFHNTKNQQNNNIFNYQQQDSIHDSSQDQNNSKKIQKQSKFSQKLINISQNDKNNKLFDFQDNDFNDIPIEEAMNNFKFKNSCVQNETISRHYRQNSNSFQGSNYNIKNDTFRNNSKNPNSRNRSILDIQNEILKQNSLQYDCNNTYDEIIVNHNNQNDLLNLQQISPYNKKNLNQKQQKLRANSDAITTQCNENKNISLNDNSKQQINQNNNNIPEINVQEINSQAQYQSGENREQQQQNQQYNKQEQVQEDKLGSYNNNRQSLKNLQLIANDKQQKLLQNQQITSDTNINDESIQSNNFCCSQNSQSNTNTDKKCIIF